MFHSFLKANAGIVLVCSMALLALVILLWTNGGRDPSPGADSSAEDGNTRLASQLERIEQRLDRLESRSTAPSRGTAVPTRDLQQSRNQARLDARERSRQARAHYDATFATSPRSGRRQNEASEQLLAQMEKPALLAEVDSPLAQDIECRAHLCRMEFFFEDLAKAEDWATFYPVTSGGQLARVETFVETEAGGVVTVVMYGQLRETLAASSR